MSWFQVQKEFPMNLFCMQVIIPISQLEFQIQRYYYKNLSCTFLLFFICETKTPLHHFL